MERKRISRILICLVFIICGLCMFSLTGKAAGGSMQEAGFDYSNQDKKDNDILVKQYEIEIPSEGNYIVYADWEVDTEGILTGVSFVYGDAVLFASSGEEVHMESEPLELGKGSYTLKLYCMQNKEEEQEFWRMTDSKPVDEGENEYVFSSEQDFFVSGNYRVEETDAEAHHSMWYVGFLAGIAMGVLFFLLVAWIVKKAGGKFGVFCKDKEKAYDERQYIARGQAYKVGFFTLMSYVTVAVFLDEVFDIHILMSLGGMWIGVCISIAVFVIICILKDAYMSLQENARGIMIVFGAIGFVNICCSSLPHLLHGEGFTEVAQGVKNGKIYEYTKLSTSSMNLISGILFFILMAVFAGKLWYDRRHEDEDEDE